MRAECFSNKRNLADETAMDQNQSETIYKYNFQGDKQLFDLLVLTRYTGFQPIADLRNWTHVPGIVSGSVLKIPWVTVLK